jgi:hypothetical protein
MLTRISQSRETIQPLSASYLHQLLIPSSMPVRGVRFCCIRYYTLLQRRIQHRTPMLGLRDALTPCMIVEMARGFRRLAAFPSKSQSWRGTSLCLRKEHLERVVSGTSISSGVCVQARSASKCSACSLHHRSIPLPIPKSSSFPQIHSPSLLRHPRCRWADGEESALLDLAKRQHFRPS